MNNWTDECHLNLSETELMNTRRMQMVREKLKQILENLMEKLLDDGIRGCEEYGGQYDWW